MLLAALACGVNLYPTVKALTLRCAAQLLTLSKSDGVAVIAVAAPLANRYTAALAGSWSRGLDRSTAGIALVAAVRTWRSTLACALELELSSALVATEVRPAAWTWLLHKG